MEFLNLNGKANGSQLRMLNFFVRMNVFAIPLYAMLLLDIRFAFVQDFVRDASFSLLSAAGFSPALNGYVLSIPIENGSWGAIINWDCTGWKSLLLMLALVMATEGKGKSKVKALAVLLPAVFVLNLLRIVFMFWVVRYDLALFPAAHAVVWSWGLIFAVLLMWYAWLRHGNTFIVGKRK